MKFHILTATLSYFTFDAVPVTAAEAAEEYLKRGDMPPDALWNQAVADPDSPWWPATLGKVRHVADGCRVFTEYQWAEYVESVK